MRLAILLLSLCSLACRSDQDAGDEFPPDYAYSGPPLHAELVDDAGGLTLYCEVDPPTEGHRLVFDRKERDGDTLVVYATLRQPPPDTPLSNDPVESITLGVPIDEEFDAIDVRIARWMEGVNYVHAPAYEQAAWIEQP